MMVVMQLCIFCLVRAPKLAGGIGIANSEEEEFLKAQIDKRMASSPGWFTKQRDALKGVSEETTTGVLRLYQLAEAGGLPFPAIM